MPEGTVLARWYREGSYRPWTVEETVRTLGAALNMAWQARVPVIRLAVAPEPAFDKALLAGPRHPALGALIQAEALLLAAQDAAAVILEAVFFGVLTETGDAHVRRHQPFLAYLSLSTRPAIIESKKQGQGIYLYSAFPYLVEHFQRFIARFGMKSDGIASRSDEFVYVPFRLDYHQVNVERKF